ncbi:transcription termination factor 2 [Dendroctonus ponderosae]|uniref:transcription termination factor 2 n=1 Tax=Dendroctonus ponderosae TaxID=77166 RepID=UPI002034F03E|nr:transcription termination factor 2 [Dendroctonus ponderosae]XP_048524338.1 transcription termination factor 2 [Dendroctonus ponderosae]KAH1026577.1 hypothetical protein HUJ05_000219 [Dendroctonus ponderosae]
MDSNESDGSGCFLEDSDAATSKRENDTVIDESYESSQQDSNSSSNELEKTEDNFRFGKRNVKKVPIIYTDSESDSNSQSSAKIVNLSSSLEESEIMSSDSEEHIEEEEESDNEEHNIIADLKNPAVEPPATVLDPDNSIKNRKAVRTSQQFNFNPDELFNSTTVYQNSPKRPTNWRLSNVHDIRETSNESSDECQIINNSSDVIEISTQITETPFRKRLFQTSLRNTRQQTLESFVMIEPVVKQLVSKSVYSSQQAQVNSAKFQLEKFSKMLNNLDIDYLPDKGESIKSRVRAAEEKYNMEVAKLQKMTASDDIQDVQGPGVLAAVPWSQIEAGANAVVPKTFGKQAMSTYNAQKAVTMDRLQQLHEALQTCPKEDHLEEDPKGLKVPLMQHQRRALAWLVFREKEIPSGGILADDMGLGKTLTMISLIVKSLTQEQGEKEDKNKRGFLGKHSKYNGGSLIVCPASLINQWSGEIDKRLKRGLISYSLYHGPKRESKANKLSQYDVVITTYSIVNNENYKQGALFQIKWRRIVLDEAHQIRNHKAQTSEACCNLSGKSRWALTGTPMHNKELDMYALLKFLRCSPFDDLQLWKRWVGDKVSGGPERLHTIISSLMLRRTKEELMGKGMLNCMPEKKWVLVKVELDKDELKLYHKILIFSRTLFAQFLHQRAEKNQDYADRHFSDENSDPPNEEYIKMREKLLRLNKFKNVSQHEILVLLLRLRQICCHPSLINSMLEEGLGDEDESSEELNILEQLEKLDIAEKHEDVYPRMEEPGGHPIAEMASSEVKVNLKEAAKGHLRSSDAIFAEERASSKIKYMLKLLQEEVIRKGDKAIIVSQWSSFLNLIRIHLKKQNIEFDQLDGKVPVVKRMDMVNKLNDSTNPMKVLLLSLTAGGVGLNLIGANHLFLLDLHWNPQLENQAQDRIYRVGQNKPVFVYKLMAVDTIEERIKLLQDKKLSMAEGMLTGTREVIQNKMSIDDLAMIFGVV